MHFRKCARSPLDAQSGAGNAESMLQRKVSTTGTFRLKALLLYLRERAPEAQYLKFAEKIGGGRIVEDETRPISTTLWQRALVDFVKLVGEESLNELADYLVHPENLGAWSRVLRNAASPDAVLQQLDDTHESLPGDPFWSTHRLDSESWFAQARLDSAEDEEQRRWMQVALQAELTAIPTLFGAGRARVERIENSSNAVDFRVYWSEVGITTQVTSLSFMATWTALSGSLWIWRDGPLWSLSATARHLFLFIPPLLGGLLGWILQREMRRYAETQAQRLRIVALEREANLGRIRSKEISRPHEEPVIAGQYRVGSQLGIGASGAVWEATRLTDNTQVAIKLLRTAVVHDVRATDRLRREAEALGLSWHPNVVEVLDTGLLPSGVGFLVMERLYGETLAERLHRGHRLSTEEARLFGLQAADALFAVHSAGVIHRDIKPDNLFLETSKDEPLKLKLIDFGVARVSWAETRLTRDGVSIGTLGYAAPEQESGSEVDGRADIYGLGVSLREALTGLSPVEGERPRASAPPLPQAWRHVLDQMTAPDPDDRFANARELREALQQLTGLPLSEQHEGDVVDVA